LSQTEIQGTDPRKKEQYSDLPHSRLDSTDHRVMDARDLEIHPGDF
jgi:hypothetical protein